MNNYTPNRRPRAQFPFSVDFSEVDNFFKKVEKTVESTFNKAFGSIALKKVEDKLVATVDVPGVAKENVSVRFEELDHGFTRLVIIAIRDGAEKVFKSEFRETVKADKAKASIDLGVLTVEVPLKQDDVKNSTEVKIS